MDFSCNTCGKKFNRKDYKNCDKLATLDTIRNRSVLADHHIDNTDFSKTKYFQHLTLPLIKPVRKTTLSGITYKEPLPKPWHYICPKSMCIICCVKTGKSDTFTTRDQFNYHRRANCPYKHINYTDYIRRKLYDTDTTLSQALEALSSDEEEEEVVRTPTPPNAKSESEDENFETQSLAYRDSIEYHNKVKQGYSNRSKKYKEPKISAVMLEQAINNII